VFADIAIVTTFSALCIDGLSVARSDVAFAGAPVAVPPLGIAAGVSVGMTLSPADLLAKFITATEL
jgi:hypothetical protein